MQDKAFVQIGKIELKKMDNKKPYKFIYEAIPFLTHIQLQH